MNKDKTPLKKAGGVLFSVPFFGRAKKGQSRWKKFKAKTLPQELKDSFFKKS